MYYRSKKTIIAFILSILLFIWCIPSYALSPDTKRPRVAVLPFNDISSSSINIKIASVLLSILSKNDFIEVIPLEIIKREILAVEPNLFWTEQRTAEKRGGIIWGIEHKVVEEVVVRAGADYTIYGNISWFNTRWRIDAYISDSDKKIIQVYSISGDKEEDMPKKLEDTSKEMIALLKKETIPQEAEEEVRRYLAGAYKLTAIVERIENLARAFPDSVPLHAILLSLYLKDKAGYKAKIKDCRLKIKKIYNPSNEKDTQYLLSLGIDPLAVNE